MVGPTGAGKTTLAWLCARLYEPQKGELYLGGRPMSRLPLGRVRRQVVVAAQRSALFSGTIRENLFMGNRGAGEAQLCAALETAQAADFVAEAGGLDAVLVQGGVNLSGGQRQRLSLARALVRGGAVLVLDDCTSALDPATERRVLDGLERRPGQAVLHITQKVRAARTAIGSWCWRRGGRWVWALTGACWTPAPPIGKSGPLRPRKRREKMAHGEASGGPVLPPQRRSLQQRFGPHARARDGRGTVRRLLALYARWGRELLLVVCLTLLSTGAALAVPYLLGRAVDCFLPWGGVERAALSVLLPTLAGAAAAQWLGNWGRRRWMEILSQRMVARIRRECFAKLGRLPLSYFDRHPHGDTMNRLVSDADNVSTVAAETVTQLLSSLLMVAGALAIMAALSPLLTLTALATVPVIVLCTRLISRRSRTLYRRQADELGRLSGLVQESLSNSRTVKLYHQQEAVGAL